MSNRGGKDNKLVISDLTQNAIISPDSAELAQLTFERLPDWRGSALTAMRKLTKSTIRRAFCLSILRNDLGARSE